jgi:hypothetical protein
MRRPPRCRTRRHRRRQRSRSPARSTPPSSPFSSSELEQIERGGVGPFGLSDPSLSYRCLRFQWALHVSDCFGVRTHQNAWPLARHVGPVIVTVRVHYWAGTADHLSVLLGRNGRTEQRSKHYTLDALKKENYTLEASHKR